MATLFLLLLRLGMPAMPWIWLPAQDGREIPGLRKDAFSPHRAQLQTHLPPTTQGTVTRASSLPIFPTQTLHMQQSQAEPAQGKEVQKDLGDK